MDPKQPIPFDDLARINENGAMTKFIMAPILLLAAALVVIAIVRTVQKARERRLTERPFE